MERNWPDNYYLYQTFQRKEKCQVTECQQINSNIFRLFSIIHVLRCYYVFLIKKTTNL